MIPTQDSHDKTGSSYETKAKFGPALNTRASSVGVSAARVNNISFRGVGRVRYGGFFFDVKLSIIGMVLFLTACSMGTITDTISPLLSHPAETRAPEPEPAYRQLISDHIGELFAANAEVQNARISKIRKVDSYSSAAWTVCLKAEMKMTDRSMVTGTYVVLIQRGQIVDRRSASPSDKCDKEKYEPLSTR